MNRGGDGTAPKRQTGWLVASYDMFDVCLDDASTEADALAYRKDDASARAFPVDGEGRVRCDVCGRMF